MTRKEDVMAVYRFCAAGYQDSLLKGERYDAEVFRLAMKQLEQELKTEVEVQ